MTRIKGSPKCFLNLTPHPLSPKGSPLSHAGLFKLIPPETHSFPAGFIPQLNSFFSVPPPWPDQGWTLASDSLFISDTGPSAVANCQHLQPSPIRARKTISPRGRTRVLPLNKAIETGLQGFDPVFGLCLYTGSPTSLQQGQLGCIFGSTLALAFGSRSQRTRYLLNSADCRKEE